MTKLEEKLIELGYVKYQEPNRYIKKNMNIVLVVSSKGRILNSYLRVCTLIYNRNDIQALKDSIEDYDIQLKIMRFDLEVLKQCQD